MNYPLPPELAKDGYATCRIETIVDVPADSFFDWYMREPVENFMVGSVMVPPIVATKPLPGPEWGMTGAARHFTFKDGTVALERILSTDLPRSYTYQPWAYDNPIRLLSDHAVSTMSALPEDGKTRIVWDYGFHARQGWMVPLLQAFVSLDWSRNLANGLKIIKAHLEAHGTAQRIHEMKKAA